VKVVILAGGAGTRVFPLAAKRPKPMFRLLGKPLVQYVIENFVAAGMREFVVVVGHESELIKDYLGDGSNFGCRIEYTLQAEPLGMANALQTAEAIVGSEDSFMVANANDIFDVSLIKAMLRKKSDTGAGILLACKPTEETWKYGMLAVEGDAVRRIVEKPPKGEEPSNLGVIGVYILPGKIFDYYRRIGTSDKQFEDAIQAFVNDGGDARAVAYDGFFGSFKHPWDLFKLNEHLMRTLLTQPHTPASCKISPKATIDGNVWFGENVRVFEGAVVKGPCYVGDNSVIGTNVLFYGCSSVGDNCVVGFGCEVKNSLVGDNCWFHTNYVGDSIIGDNCSFGAGTVTANYRFDEGSVPVNIKGESVDSGRDKLGAIIGDNCKTGINVSLLPGVKLGPGSFVGPGVVLQEDLPPNKMVFVDRKSNVIKDRSIEAAVGKREELLKKLTEHK